MHAGQYTNRTFLGQQYVPPEGRFHQYGGKGVCLCHAATHASPPACMQASTRYAVLWLPESTAPDAVGAGCLKDAIQEGPRLGRGGGGHCRRVQRSRSKHRVGSAAEDAHRRPMSLTRPHRLIDYFPLAVRAFVCLLMPRAPVLPKSRRMFDVKSPVSF